MDAKTSEALDKSITHWEANVAAESPQDVKIGADFCALCKIFQGHANVPDCIGCPVATRTGNNFCRQTPYYDAKLAFLYWLYGDCSRDAWIEKARAMLDFLISLREPKEESPS